jgi:hypothetical protein
VLGTAGINYYYPIPIIRRARSLVEQAVGVPDVLFVGTIRPTIVAGIPSGIPREQMLSFDVVMPPVAVMVTNPALPVECRAPIIPPGNVLETYTRIWVDCQELPTGNYDVNILNGLAGAQVAEQLPVCMADCLAAGRTEMQCTTQCSFTVPAITENGFSHCFNDPGPPARRVCTGNYSSQAWTIPNELGCPDVDYRIGAVNQLDQVRPDGSLPACGDPESVMLPSQSRSGGFAVVDSADNPPEQAMMSTVDGHGIAQCQMAVSSVDGTTQPVTYRTPDNPACCSPRLDQFCGLPLCALRGPSDVYPGAVIESIGGSRSTREIRIEGEDFVRNADGTVTPLCTPFLMPVECCRMAERCAADPCTDECRARDPSACG